MIRRHRALVPLAFALMIASTPGPASASHTRSEDDPYSPIKCYSGTKPPVQVRSQTGLFTGFATCVNGDADHYQYEVRRADGVEAKGIVTFDPEDGRPAYNALRVGRDQVIVKVSDGISEATTTIDLEIRPWGNQFVGDQVLRRNRVISLGEAGCPPEFPFPVGSCRSKATARASIRERGRPRRTVTIGRASATTMPGQGKDLNVRLSRKFVRVLKRARQMKVTVVLTTQQTDPFGLWEAKLKDGFRLYWSP